MSSPILFIFTAAILLQSSTLSYAFLFGKSTTTATTTTTTSSSVLSALVPGVHSQHSPSSSNMFKSDSSHSLNSMNSGSSSSFGSHSSLQSHIRIRQTNMSHKDQELAVKLMMDAVKRFGYKIGKVSRVEEKKCLINPFI